MRAKFHNWFHAHPEERENFSRWFTAALRTDVLTMFVHRGVDELDLTPVGQATADGGVQVVRIVPAGGLVLDERDLDELRQVFGGIALTGIVPGPGTRAGARQLDLLVAAPGPASGQSLRLTGPVA